MQILFREVKTLTLSLQPGVSFLKKLKFLLSNKKRTLLHIEGRERKNFYVIEKVKLNLLKCPEHQGDKLWPS
jgi:hypothetical protein